MIKQNKLRNLDDLALKAGVSAATVSMALRDSPRLSEEVKNRIKELAKESNFVPRVYKRRTPVMQESTSATVGSLLVIYDEFKHFSPESVRELVMPILLIRLNQRHIQYKTMTWDEIATAPQVLHNYSAVFYYNEPLQPVLPLDFPSSQLFGWQSLGNNQDRITANEQMVAEIATDYLCLAQIDQAVICWCQDMISFPDHPRITGFFSAMQKRNIPVTELPFTLEQEGEIPGLSDILHSGRNTGFFGWNAFSGFKLCCALDRYNLLTKYTQNRLIICDNSPLLKSFIPNPAIIDLNIPAMVELALEAFCRRITCPKLPSTLTLVTPELIWRNIE